MRPVFTTSDSPFEGCLETETEVFTFAAITISVFIEDMNLNRLDDKHIDKCISLR
jgi:hypothetical protein